MLRSLSTFRLPHGQGPTIKCGFPDRALKAPSRRVISHYLTGENEFNGGAFVKFSVLANQRRVKDTGRDVSVWHTKKEKETH